MNSNLPRNLNFTPAPQVDDEIDLLALAGTLWRGKWLIGLFAILAVVAGGLYAFVLAVPMYPAKSVIALEAQEQQVITDIESVLSGGGQDTATINTETVVLRSRGLIGQLVDRLALVDDPEFNATLRDEGFSPGGAIAGLLGRGNETPPTETEIRNTVIDTVIGAISVSNIRQSLAFEITATTTNPVKSADMANMLADLYIENQLSVKFEANERASQFLSNRAAELQQTLEQMEGELNVFTDSSRLISPEALIAQSRQLKDLRDRLEGQVATLAERQALRASLVRLRGNGDLAGLAALANDTRLSRAVADDNSDRALALADALIERLAIDIARAEQQITALRESEVTLSAENAQQSEDLIRLQQLQRETQATRLLYESFLNRLKETNVQRGLQTADSRILSEAVPRPPSSPRKGMILALSGLLGLMAGAGLVLLREMKMSNFRTSDELRDATGQTVMGSIPVIPGKARRDALTYLRQKPASIVAEAVRNLRTSVLLSNVDSPPQVIMVTSSVPSEGKTTVSLALAQNMASLGKRVLLIEGDMRRRTFAQYFNVEHATGLLDAIANPALLQPGNLHQTDLGVDLLIGTKANINAADLFASDRFANLLQIARQRYDFILIDTPPVLVVPDARVIGQQTDAILYVVRWNQTSRTQVRQGTEMFQTVGLKLNGLVLSQVDSKQMKRYGYGGEYGYDAYKSKYYDQ